MKSSFSILLVIVGIAQLFLILHLISLIRQKDVQIGELNLQMTPRMEERASLSRILPVLAANPNPVSMSHENHSCVFQGTPKGVAVTLMLNEPLWYQRRYSMMIQNTLANIPSDWIIQIFYTGKGGSLQGLTANPGIQRFISTNRVHLTLIPEALLTKKKRRIELMTDPWLWENILAEKVLIFSGGSVICSNSPAKLTDFLHFDYLGAPWSTMKGFGGEGTISIRSRSLMTQVIAYELEKHAGESKEARENAFKSYGQEDVFFVSRMKEMLQKGLLFNTNHMIGENLNHKNLRKIRSLETLPESVSSVFLANHNDSLQWAAIGGSYSPSVFAVSGTLPDVPFKERDKFLSLCPEMKMFYPALHDPHCFGASPDSEKCGASICALKPKEQRKGGC